MQLAILMEPGDFPRPFVPLGLPEKPLAGDLPVDMEFGEDLLESQTAPALQSAHGEDNETTSMATGRRGSSEQEEELPLQGQPQIPSAPPSPSVGDNLGDGVSSSQAKSGGPSPPAQLSLPGDGLIGKATEKPPERKRSERVRRAEPSKPEVVDSTESIPVSDEDSDAMVDDPNDEDFVPFRPRRSPRMSLRSSTAQRAGRSSAVATKMTCAHCRTPLQKGQTAYQRKGLPQLFCSSSCLTTFSKKPSGKKICTFCKKEIWNTKDSVVAQTGSGGSFHEFCTSVCLSLYEAQQQRPAAQAGDPADATRCSICQKTGEVLHEVSNGSVVHRLCSDSCFSKFRANKGLKTNCCDQCGAYIYTKTGSAGPELLFHEGQQKRFCNTTCLGAYKKVGPRE